MPNRQQSRRRIGQAGQQVSKGERRPQSAQRESRNSNTESFLRRFLRVALFSIWRGFRKLSTPGGVLAAVPLVVSAVAYLRTTVETSALHLFLNQPIAFEAILTEGAEDGSWNVWKAGGLEFEFFLTNTGVATIYLQRLVINVVLALPNAKFSKECVYEHSPTPDEPHSQTIEPPYRLATRVLSKNYPYELSDGFVLTANSVTPLKGILLSESMDPLSEERVNSITGGQRAPGLDSRILDLITKAKKESIEVCISGTAFVSGSAAQNLHWAGNPNAGDVRKKYSEKNMDSPPVAPGGQPVPALRVFRLELYGGNFQRGIPLFSHRKINLI